jgi:hypothetical protein
MDRVQVSDGKKKTVYTALQVRRVNLAGENFAPVKLDNSVRLMKVFQSGFLSLYGYRATGQSGFDTKVLHRLGTNAIEVPNIGFKKFVGDLVADCASVFEKVKSGDFGRNDVESMVTEYNACVSNNNQHKAESVAKSSESPAAELIEQMKIKVNASTLDNKPEVNDLLTSIGDRLRKNETIPAYMKEGLKGYLGNQEDLKTDMEQLFSLIDK